MANTLIAKLVGGAAVAAAVLSTLVAPGAASAATARVHQTSVSVFSVASRQAAARQSAARAKFSGIRAHKIVQRELHADRRHMQVAAIQRRNAVAAHRRKVVVTKIIHTREYKKH